MRNLYFFAEKDFSPDKVGLEMTEWLMYAKIEKNINIYNSDYLRFYAKLNINCFSDDMLYSVKLECKLVITNRVYQDEIKYKP